MTTELILWWFMLAVMVFGLILNAAIGNWWCAIILSFTLGNLIDNHPSAEDGFDDEDLN